ncbi:HNH endonuclease signature motif containing protein [Arthrobacter silvisoli]|uniref:HNH endonuclease signature motif containing protein n=1 Tax=Arthrobacter silvisoli TaxID=2291022 RepID=UPI000E219789|nr:HNH endonuclease signature motif containing protein [Arthrobacter silvisoli]
MEKTSSLSEGTPQSDAAFDPLAVLDGMVSTLGSLESAIASLQALREFTLALASRLADVMNDGGAALGGTVRSGFTAAAWDSRSAELAQRAVAAEVATATRANDRSIQRQMGQAVELLDRFPAAFNALAQGRISLAHARVIQDAGAPLDDPAALARYESVVVPCAEKQAPGRVRRLAVREAEQAQPDPLADRHERAVAERHVRVTSQPDGMAELTAVLPAAVAYGIHDRLTQMARAHAEACAQTGPPVGSAAPGRSHDENRNTDQLRADLLAELLLRGAPTAHDTPDGLLAAITARVDVTVPVLTLIDGGPASAAGSAATSNPAARRPEQVPAELDGRHPIDPVTARVLAGQATAWNRVLTDPFTGAVLAVERYRPGEDLKRLLAARDTRCRFPGCGIRASDLDLDHTQDAALGGATEASNLAGLCRRHHMLKHHSLWKVRQTGAGVLEWTSPTGRRTTDHPPRPATTTVGTGNKPPPF